MSERDGGAALKYCSKSSCNASASHRQGHQWLCQKHYRFGQMRAKAKQAGKSVPTTIELETLAKNGLRCGDCNLKMTWLGRENQHLVVTLQHYRDGSYG